MFKKLQQKWKVGPVQLVLVFITFALGGSLCGYLGRLIIKPMGIENRAFWLLLYIVFITILWPLCVLLISIPLGQFRFFSSYVGKIIKRFSGSKQQSVINVAIFASGAGSNAEKIIESSATTANWKVALIVCNKPGAGVLNIAAKNDIPSLLIEKERFFNGDSYLPLLKEHNIDFIALAGFLWKLPHGLIEAYPQKIINIHPALLPKFGGKGMYGHYVHEAVLAAGEKQSGITIHYVDGQYDHGQTIFRASCDVAENDTPETLAKKIHALEHVHYPAVLNNLLAKL